MHEKLNLNAPWSLGEEAFKRIVGLFNRQSPGRIVEFGSGRSSIRLAMAFPQARILSIENDRRSFDRARALMEEFLTGSNLIIRYRPLKFQAYGSRPILSYEEDSFFGEEMIDCVLIDGPPFFTLRGREACLYQSYGKVKIGGLVILDDYSRKSEKIIVNNWHAVYPGSFQLEILAVDNELAVLQKIKPIEPHWDDPLRCQDSVIVADNYSRVQSAMLHLDDTAWRSAVQLLWGKTDPQGDILGLINTVREAYNISLEQIQETLRLDAQLAPRARALMQATYLKTLLEIFFPS